MPSKPPNRDDELPDDPDLLQMLWDDATELYQNALRRDTQGAIRAIALRARIEAKQERIAARQGNGWGDIDEATLLERLTRVFDEMPDPHLRLAADAWRRRKRLRWLPEEE